MNELAVSFKQQIIESHEKGKASDERLCKEILNNINLKRQTALLLESAERDLKWSQWRQLKETLPMDNAAIKNYFSLLHRFPEPAVELKIALQSIKKAMQVTECLPNSPGKGETLHEPTNFFTESTLAVIRLTSAFRKYVARHPIKTWEPQTAELFLRSFEPVVNCYREVAAWLKSTQC